VSSWSKTMPPSSTYLAVFIFLLWSLSEGVAPTPAHEVSPVKLIPRSLSSARCPLVYVFIQSEFRCVKMIMQEYLIYSLQNTLRMQPECEVIFASNFGECGFVYSRIQNTPSLHGLTLFDISSKSSNKTNMFRNASKSLFMSDHGGELWMNSAVRFFVIEDVMRYYGYHSVLHVEADNMLYGSINSIWSTLQLNYTSMTATRLTPGRFVTASVLWVPRLETLTMLNDYLIDLALGDRNGTWKGYIQYLRVNNCITTRSNGIEGHTGSAVKPFCVNEMSMLAYFDYLFPGNFSYLPLMPTLDFKPAQQQRADYALGGSKTRGPIGVGIWDSGSWGQHLGGTHGKHGRDAGRFVDMGHVISVALTQFQCVVHMLCGNRTVLEGRMYNGEPMPDDYKYCFTAPFVRCQSSAQWTPLWNLHVHSKNNHKYMSELCQC